MSWIEGLKSVFRRGDVEAARLAIGAAIEREERPDLERISTETEVKLSTVNELTCAAIASDTRRRLAEGIEAGWVPTEGIHTRAVELGLSAEAAKGAIEGELSNHFTALVQDALGDGMVDPEEDRRIGQFMSMIGASTLKADTAELIEEGRRLYRASSAPLTQVDAPVLLKKGEYCVYAVTAEALEDRSRTVRVNYGGPSARIRIAKGIYYNIGSLAVTRQTEGYQHSFGVGVLCMTNKRLLWISDQKSISTPLANIVRYDPYSDGVRIMKGTGKPLLFLWTDDARIATIMAARTIEELRD